MSFSGVRPGAFASLKGWRVAAARAAVLEIHRLLRSVGRGEHGRPNEAVHRWFVTRHNSVGLQLAQRKVDRKVGDAERVVRAHTALKRRRSERNGRVESGAKLEEHLPGADSDPAAVFGGDLVQARNRFFARRRTSEQRFVPLRRSVVPVAERVLLARCFPAQQLVTAEGGQAVEVSLRVLGSTLAAKSHADVPRWRGSASRCRAFSLKTIDGSGLPRVSQTTSITGQTKPLRTLIMSQRIPYPPRPMILSRPDAGAPARTRKMNSDANHPTRYANAMSPATSTPLSGHQENRRSRRCHRQIAAPAHTQGHKYTMLHSSANANRPSRFSPGAIAGTEETRAATGKPKTPSPQVASRTSIAAILLTQISWEGSATGTGSSTCRRWISTAEPATYRSCM